MLLNNYTELIIGFINSPLQVDENGSFATVEFGITSGRIATNHLVSVQLFLLDLAALSKI